MHKPSKLPVPATNDTAGPSLYRSGAVALRLRMPVASLRVWERRYGLAQPLLSPSGQRLYSAADVRRLALLKQLTDLGHAIGSLALLDVTQLQRVAATHVHALAATQTPERPHAAPVPPLLAWRLAVVGAALGTRLQRPVLLRRLGRPVALLGPFLDSTTSRRPPPHCKAQTWMPCCSTNLSCTRAGWPPSMQAHRPWRKRRKPCSTALLPMPCVKPWPAPALVCCASRSPAPWWRNGCTACL